MPCIDDFKISVSGLAEMELIFLKVLRLGIGS